MVEAFEFCSEDEDEKTLPKQNFIEKDIVPTNREVVLGIQTIERFLKSEGESVYEKLELFKQIESEINSKLAKKSIQMRIEKFLIKKTFEFFRFI